MIHGLSLAAGIGGIDLGLKAVIDCQGATCSQCGMHAIDHDLRVLP